MTFPYNYYIVACISYFLFYLLCLIIQVMGIVLLAVGRTAVKVTAMILKHCLGCRFVTIYRCPFNPAFTTMPTEGVVYMKVSFFCLVFQPID